MPVACRACDEQLVDNALFCEHCGATQHPALFQPTTVAVPAAEPVVDPWLPHALRAVGVGLLLIVAWMTFVLGLLWRLRILDVTGYRKRDLLWLWIPVVGTIGEVRTVWRYTAKDVYWTPRDDRPSDVLDGWARPVAIGAGWLTLPIVAGGAAAAWIDDDGRCVAEDVRAALEAEDGFSFGNLGDAIDGALERCDIDLDLDGGPEPDLDPDPDPTP